MARRSPSSVVLALLLVPLVIDPVGGQDVRPGSRIRVRGPCGVGEHCLSVTGGYIGWSGTTLTLQDGQGTQHRHEITTASTVEVFRGSRGHALAGLGIGAGVGLIAGALLTGDCVEEAGDTPVAGLCGTNVVAGVGLGSLVGLLVGSLARTERWDRLSSPGLAVIPSSSGLGFAARARF